jgi:dTDP-4-amino-4,6-dideoxygalactose transaminase
MSIPSQSAPVRSIITHSCPDIGEAEIEALVECALSLQLKGGERVGRLESLVSHDLCYPGAVAATSGAQAIHLALRARFPGGRAHVGVPSFVCRSVYDAVCLAECQPVLLDIDSDTFSLSLQAMAGQRCDAAIVPHMFGICARLQEFCATGIVVIEDCAQRLAPTATAASEPRPILRILSFEATKLLTCGEGGLLLSSENAVLERARKLRHAPYDFPEPAACLPLTDIQAAIALVQWQRLPEFLTRRRELARFYLDVLQPRFADRIADAMRRDDTYHFRFVLKSRDPDAFIRFGAGKGVHFRRPIAPIPLHRLFRTAGNFSNTEEAFSHLVSIPLYPRLTQEEAGRVVEITMQALEAY